MKKYIVYTFALVAMFLFMGFSEPKKEMRVMRLDAYKSVQYYEHFKRLVYTSEEKEIAHIEGFNFEWGYTYVLKLEVHTLANRFSDGTAHQYKLEKIIAKVPALTNGPFELLIDPERYYTQENDQNLTIVPMNDSTYRYFEDISMVVPHQLSNEFNAILTSKSPKMGIFEFIDHQFIKLIEIK